MAFPDCGPGSHFYSGEVTDTVPQSGSDAGTLDTNSADLEPSKTYNWHARVVSELNTLTTSSFISANFRDSTGGGILGSSNVQFSEPDLSDLSGSFVTPADQVSAGKNPVRFQTTVVHNDLSGAAATVEFYLDPDDWVEPDCAEPPPPDPGIEVGVYDPDGVFIADVTDAFGKSIRVELDGTGQGTFSINRYSSQATATNLAQGNLVKVTYPQISDNPIFAWFMDEGDFDLVSTDEEGGEDLVFAGQGALSYLGRAIMWDRSFLESLNHVLLGPGSRFIYTKSGSDLVSRTSVSFAVATTYSAGAAETLDFPPGGSSYNDRTYVPITSGPHTGKYVSTKWLTVPFVGDGSWRLFAAGSGTAPGQILRRVIEEAQTIDRPQYPLAAMTVDFDYTNDSDSNAWDDGAGVTDEFTAQVGEDVLAVALRLVDTGAIEVQMDPDLGLHAYNHYGRTLTSGTFAADKVRFVRGVNIADILRRSVGLKLPATHALIDGDDAITATAELGVIGQPVVETYISLEGSDPTVLAAAGEAILINEYGQLQSATFPIDVADDPETGRYLPGPPGTNGHFWVGDTVTLDTGDTTIDYTDDAVRVMALTIAEDDAGNIDCIVELQATINPAWWRNRLIGRGGTGGRIIVKGTPRTEVSGTEGTQISPADVDLSDYATDADLAAHTGDTTDAHDASAISFTPAGTIAATDVQAAIEEVASESLTNPMTTPADLIVGGTAGVPTRLAKGSDGQVLTVDPTTHLLVWATPTGGSGTITTKDEGSTLSSTVTTLDFVGAGVTASGAGATTTVTIPGASGSSTIKYGSNKPATPLDDFDASSLDAAWAAEQNNGTFATTDVYTQALDGSHASLGFKSAMGYLRRSATNVDQEWQCGGLRGLGQTGAVTAMMFGIAILDASEDGMGVLVYNDNNVYLARITGGQYASFDGSIANLGHNINHATRWDLRLTRVGNTWDGYASLGGQGWAFHASATGSRTITADRKCIGIFYNTADQYKGELLVDWVDTQ